jgi:hypothetical protein
MIDKITKQLQQGSTLFKDQVMYPRRYFDDLLMEQRIHQQQVENSKDQQFKASDQKRLRDLILNKASLGISSGKESVRGSLVGKFPRESKP